ncbi:MAG: hypothetical protein NWE89_14960 [Candidatus Bathyarchaeota archaeon]|nr:hypothetical protein [Candidatus Bathyarchaeota archaeon]
MHEPPEIELAPEPEQEKDLCWIDESIDEDWFWGVILIPIALGVE